MATTFPFVDQYMATNGNIMTCVGVFYILSILRLQSLTAVHFLLSKYLSMQPSGYSPRKKGKKHGRYPWAVTIFQYDNVKVISPLSSFYWRTETLYAPGPSPRDLNTKALISHVILIPQKVPRP